MTPGTLKPLPTSPLRPHFIGAGHRKTIVREVPEAPGDLGQTGQNWTDANPPIRRPGRVRSMKATGRPSTMTQAWRVRVSGGATPSFQSCAPRVQSTCQGAGEGGFGCQTGVSWLEDVGSMIN